LKHFPECTPLPLPRWLLHRYWITQYRCIARPAVAIPRLSLSSTGKVVYTLNTPYRDGTTQVAFEPVDFITRLAALAPKPRVNLTRYQGVLASFRREGVRELTVQPAGKPLNKRWHG